MELYTILNFIYGIYFVITMVFYNIPDFRNLQDDYNHLPLPSPKFLFFDTDKNSMPCMD